MVYLYIQYRQWPTKQRIKGLGQRGGGLHTQPRQQQGSQSANKKWRSCLKFGFLLQKSYYRSGIMVLVFALPLRHILPPVSRIVIALPWFNSLSSMEYTVHALVETGLLSTPLQKKLSKSLTKNPSPATGWCFSEGTKAWAIRIL